MPNPGRRTTAAGGRRAFGLAVALLSLLVLWAPARVAAQSLAGDPAGRDRWMFDLMPRVTDDPDLLTAREALLRQKLLDLGVDPRGERRRPTLQTILERRMADAARAPLFEPPRQVEILEVDARLGLITVYRFPETYPFFTSPDTNVVGVAFEPQRALADSSVQLSMHGQAGWLRTWRTIGFYDKWGAFVRQRKAAEATDGGLLNFTVPIRLPRTIERLIGRGDATNIRISGSETISIAGESTVRSNFLGSEIRQSQSLFPTLEMEQQLRVQLEGTVGEKIKVRVSHDSEAIGTTATEVKLAFEGDEDDIIRTIRAGNIDITLPGSALLGVGAQRGGLFGIKIEGALGGLKFTALTSKEQSEQSKATFNQQGGTSEEVIIANTDYVKNRYFRLSTSQFGAIFFPQQPGRPALEEFPGYDPAQLEIDPNSIELFVTPATGTGADILDLFDGWAFVDTTGRGWEGEGVPFDPGVLPEDREVHAERWRRLNTDEWELLKDSQNQTIGIVLDRSLGNAEAMGVVYTLVDRNTQAVVRRVGRSPSATPGTVTYTPPNATEPEQIYLFKLIKPNVSTTPKFIDNEWGSLDLTWEYMFRNWYDLRGVDIDARSLAVRIQRSPALGNNPDLDLRHSIPWLRVWGLDRFNEQGGDPNTPDDRIDSQIGVVDYSRGTLQFPDFTPFTLSDAILEQYSRIPNYVLNPDSTTELRAKNLYTTEYTGDLKDLDHHFDIVAKHSSTSSRFRLNALNIKEGSEQVTLDGAVLNRGTDYEIDYFSGEVTLKDAAARLNAQSNIQITYEVDPLFGGGRTSLHGFNLQYELGLNKSLSTTWLLQSQPSPNRKPRLGEEPSKTWVGNVAAKMRFAPGILTWIANLLPRVESDDASTLTLDSEVAMSVPNPNTRGQAYLEDFESVDDSEDISLSREGWYWASLPAEYDIAQPTERRMTTANRVLTRWYRPSEGNAVKRGHLNPTLSQTERNDVLTALQLHVDPGVDGWLPDDYGGIMRGYSGPVDLTQAQFLEFWVNDNRGAPGDLPRTGLLHFDFGYINEDFYWPPGPLGLPLQHQFEKEDADRNGVASEQEDIGLDGAPDGSEGGPYQPDQPAGEGSDTAGDNYQSDERLGAELFPFINGTENNQRLDGEDLNRNTILDEADGYFTLQLDLADTTEVIADIYRDYAGYPDFIRESGEAKRSWRKYRIDLRRIQQCQSQDIDGYPAKDPDLSKVYFVRVWFENPAAPPTELARDLVFAEMRFLGNRWRADALRNLVNRRLDSVELCPDPNEPGALEDFRLGVVNNKDDANYAPPVFPDTRNNIAEKEQSLLFRYTALAPGHQGRARKDIPSPQGQDFSVYGELNYFWRAPLGTDRRPDRTQFGLEPYFWVGSDSTNYYEVGSSFAEADLAAPIADDGWIQVRLDLADLTNVKLASEGVLDSLEIGPDKLRFRRGTVEDLESGRSYRVRVVGAPDLRRIRRYYAGVRYPSIADSSGCGAGPLLSGEVLFNEIRLREVDREKGFAKRVAVNTTFAGLGDFGVVWSETDPAFRGLNAKTGTNVLKRDWELRGSSRLDRFIPTLGLEIPFSLTRRQSLELPRFRTNTDIELLDAAAKELEKSTTKASSYNFQIRRTKASRHKLLAYTWDHLGFSRSGSKSEDSTPTQESRRISREDRYTYDLNLTGGFDAKLPLIKTTWRYLPNQLSLSSSWRFDDSYRTPWLQNADGTRRQGTVQRSLTNTGTHTGTLSYSPMRSLRSTYTVNSARDRVRPQWALGINWGGEDTYSERLTLNYTPGLPFIRALQPDVSYTGNYTENRRVAPRAGDEAWRLNQGVRHFNNDRDITTRWQMDIGGFVRKRFGAAQPGAPKARQTPNQQRRDAQRLDTRGRRGEEPTPPRAVPPGQPAVPDTTEAGRRGSGRTSGKGTGRDQTEPAPLFPPDTQEPPPFGDQQPIPEEEGADQPPPEEGQQPVAPEGLPPAEPEQPQERFEPPPAEAPAAPADTTGGEAARKLDPLAPLRGIARPFVMLAKEMQPIRASYSIRNTSAFQYMWDRASAGYRLGMSDDPALDPPDSVKITPGSREPDHSESFGQTKQLQLSTQSKLAQNTTLDLSYQEQRSERSGSGRTTRDVSVQWPTATLKLSGLEKWRIFGDSFASSSLDISLRRTKEVRGMTATSYQPRHGTTLSPRWNFRFKSEFSGNLGVTYSNDVTGANDKDQVSQRLGVNLKLQKSFDAEGALGFLRFGHKGLGTKIESTLDVSYDRANNFRRYEDAAENVIEDQGTGNSRLSVAPNFSYQFSRAVRAGFRLSYGRTKDLSSKVSTQSFGLGLNATLTF